MAVRYTASSSDSVYEEVNDNLLNYNRADFAYHC